MTKIRKAPTSRTGHRPAPATSASGLPRKKITRVPQGAALPAAGSALDEYPTGCCVVMSLGGLTSWHMILYRIGGEGSPHCGRMSIPPSVAGWNAGVGEGVEVRASTIVLESCWPYRPAAAEAGEGQEKDPLAGSPIEGSLMLGHLSAGRDHRAAAGQEISNKEGSAT